MSIKSSVYQIMSVSDPPTCSWNKNFEENSFRSGWEDLGTRLGFGSLCSVSGL